MTTDALEVSLGSLWERTLVLWARVLRLSRRAPRRLRLCETLALGDRRFVAVVEFERARFLVGGTPSSLVLLSRLEDSGERLRDRDRDRDEDQKEKSVAWRSSAARAEKCDEETC